MILDDFPSVVTHGQESFKFLLLELKDALGTGKIILRTSDGGSHEWIYMNFLTKEAKNENIQVNVVGGGRIQFAEGKPIISIYDQSNDYGKEPDRNITAAMLRSAYPHLEIVIR